MLLRSLPLLAALLLVGSVMGQNKGKNKNKDKNTGEGPHKDLYLPVECLITANGGSTDKITVTVFKDNEQAFELSPEKNKSSFLLDLDLDSYYTVRASKEGYRDKTVYIDTHLPENEMKYKSTSFGLNMEGSDKFAHSDQFYLDFPSAIIRWDEQKKNFAHNDEYLANIQLKMALLGAQLEAQ
jgi:hypothetical protein